MERLKNLMNEKGYNRHNQENIEKLLKYIEPHRFEKTVNVFMDIIEKAQNEHEADRKCTTYISDMYGGRQVRTKILRIFRDRDYPHEKTNRFMLMFGQIPFDEKENFAKRILPIVEEAEDIDLIIKRTRENIKEFKKEIENQRA